MDVMLRPFQEIVDIYWRDVARLTAALAGPDDADDAAQRTWLRALEAYPSLEHDRNVRGWLLTIAANTAIDGKRQRRRRAVPVAEVPEVTAHTPSPSVEDDDLWSLVRNLPERQRTAVALRYVLDFSHHEIARALGTTPAATRRLVSDALNDLRRRLEITGELHDRS